MYTLCGSYQEESKRKWYFDCYLDEKFVGCGLLYEDIIVIENKKYCRFFHEKCIHFRLNDASCCDHDSCGRNSVTGICDSSLIITSHIPNTTETLKKMMLSLLNQPFAYIRNNINGHPILFNNTYADKIQFSEDWDPDLITKFSFKCEKCNETFDAFIDLDLYC